MFCLRPLAMFITKQTEGVLACAPSVFERRFFMTKGQDFLSGSVPGKLIAFALPLLFANILQSLYNVVDMLVVGRFVGETGLAAISNASKLCYILNSICIGITMGGAVLIAQYKGANDKKGQAETFQMLSLLSLAASILLTVISSAIYRPVFRVLEVPADAFGDACDYMRIICFGTVFVFGYNAVCSVLKGLGDSKSPLCFAGIAAVINVGLDVVLVGPLGLGTKGAACATVTAQGISFLFSLFYLKRHHVFLSAAESRKFTARWDKMAAILKIGLPAATQMVVVNTAYLLVTGMLNRFGTSVSAAAGVGLQINTFAGMPCWAVGQAAATLVVVLCVQVFAEQLILLFGGDSREVVACGVYYLRVCCGVNSFIYAAMYTLDSFAMGVGAANIAMLNALLDAVVLRLPASWVLAFTLGMGYSGICFGQALSPLLPAVAGFIYYKSGKWEYRRTIEKSLK